MNIHNLWDMFRDINNRNGIWLKTLSRFNQNAKAFSCSLIKSWWGCFN